MSKFLRKSVLWFVLLVLTMLVIGPFLTNMNRVNAAVDDPTTIIRVTDKNRERVFKTKLASNTTETYNPNDRTFEGVPSIARTKGGRLFSMWQTGGTNEPDVNNYFVVAYSDDNGKSWVDPYLILDHPDKNVGLMPFTMWVDDANKLWIGYSHGGKYRWVITTENPDANPEEIEFSSPKKLPMDFTCLTKPLMRSNGEWLLAGRKLTDESVVEVWSSLDRGITWTLKGEVEGEPKWAPEPMIVELSNGKLWMLSRVNNVATLGVESCYSDDGGETWYDVKTNLDKPLQGPGSRFWFSKLKSGNLLFITNDSITDRSFLKAYLSKDEGKTWTDGMPIDMNVAVSYPDVAEAEDGTLFCIWDRARYGGGQYIACSSFTETALEGDAQPKMTYITVANKSLLDIMNGVVKEDDDKKEEKNAGCESSVNVTGCALGLSVLGISSVAIKKKK